MVRFGSTWVGNAPERVFTAAAPSPCERPRQRRNGAGGIRTPVPWQSAGGFYAHSPLFHLGLGPGTNTLTFGQAPRNVSPFRAKRDNTRRPARCLMTRPLSGVASGSGGTQAARANCGSAVIVLRAFYEASTPLGTPPQAFPVRSIPVGPNHARTPTGDARRAGTPRPAQILCVLPLRPDKVAA